MNRLKLFMVTATLGMAGFAGTGCLAQVDHAASDTVQERGGSVVEDDPVSADSGDENVGEADQKWFTIVSPPLLFGYSYLAWLRVNLAIGSSIL